MDDEIHRSLPVPSLVPVRPAKDDFRMETDHCKMDSSILIIQVLDQVGAGDDADNIVIVINDR